MAFFSSEVIFHLDAVLVFVVDEFLLHFQQLADQFLLLTHDRFSRFR
jgi:hypothetical protein